MKYIKSLLAALLLTSVCHAEQKVISSTDLLKVTALVNKELDSGEWKVVLVFASASVSHGAAFYNSFNKIDEITKNNAFIFVLEKIKKEDTIKIEKP